MLIVFRHTQTCGVGIRCFLTSVLCVIGAKLCDTLLITGCPVAVDKPQCRYDLRHDSILLHIVKQMHASKTHSGKRIIADVADFKLPDGGTIPPEIVVTNKRPDIVLVDEKTGDVELFELTSCADSLENIKNAQSRKSVRYALLVGDIKSTGVEAKATPFEVCALGNIPSHARQTIRYLVGKNVARGTFKSLAKIAVSASYYIFNRRRDMEWRAPPLFERRTIDHVVKK